MPLMGTFIDCLHKSQIHFFLYQAKFKEQQQSFNASHTKQRKFKHSLNDQNCGTTKVAGQTNELNAGGRGQDSGTIGARPQLCVRFRRTFIILHWAMFMIVISRRQSFGDAFNKLSGLALQWVYANCTQIQVGCSPRRTAITTIFNYAIKSI